MSGFTATRRDLTKSTFRCRALAHQVEAALGRPELDQMLRDAIPDLQHEPSPLHAELLTLPWSDVFTTNYDTLLERARRSVISRRYDVVLKPDDLGHSNRPRIVKLHGSLPSERPFIITDEDYRRYPHDFAPFVNAVRQALLEDTLCLIGFSGDDPNFLQWAGWIQDNLGHRNSPKMYLVGLLNLPLPRKLCSSVATSPPSICPFAPTSATTIRQLSGFSAISSLVARATAPSTGRATIATTPGTPALTRQLGPAVEVPASPIPRLGGPPARPPSCSLARHRRVSPRFTRRRRPSRRV